MLFQNRIFVVLCCFAEVNNVNGFFARNNTDGLFTKSLDSTTHPSVTETYSTLTTKATSEEQTQQIEVDQYTFAVLLQIAFVDGSRKSCTGTVIHDNVVITAAQCFLGPNTSPSLPELGMSFVVIGTKRMYLSGYENYVPIERVKIHPRFEGWEANLALVYTHTGLVSDKSGTAVSFTEGKPLDSTNITVISWSSVSNDRPSTQIRRLGDVTRRTQFPYSVSDENSENIFRAKYDKSNANRFLSTKMTRGYSYSSEDSDDYRQKRRHIKHRFENEYRKSIYTNKVNMRRFEGPQQNHLVIENFKLMNIATCRRIVQKSKSAKYFLRDTSTMSCYGSEYHYITEEDAGAPAIQNGKLIAVTSGGAESEGEHVAVGMKISCFCSWIAKNLPPGEKKYNCCLNCCTARHDVEMVFKI